MIFHENHLLEISCLIFSKIGKDVTKFVVCCSCDWRFKGYRFVPLIIFSEGTEVHNNSSVRPYFEEPLHSISVSVGEDAIFKCAAKGNPTPVFKWYVLLPF